MYRRGFSRWRSLVFVVVGVVVLSLAGCFRVSEPVPSREEVLQQMLDHLEVKYGRAFEVRNAYWGKPWYDGWGAGGRTTFNVYPSGEDQEQYFTVEADRSATSLSFHDGYVGNLMTPIYEEKVQLIVAHALPGVIVELNMIGQSDYPPDDFTAETTFEQFKAYADQKARLIFCVFFPLAEGQGKADIEALTPGLEAAVRPIVGYGTLSLMGYSKQDFTERVEPVLRGEVERNSDIPAAGFILVDTDVTWKV